MNKFGCFLLSRALAKKKKKKKKKVGYGYGAVIYFYN